MRGEMRGERMYIVDDPAILRVAIVDDHPVTRLGIECILASHQGTQVVCSVADLAEFWELGVHPDLVILDLYLGGGRLTQAQIEAVARRYPVLVVSASCVRTDVLAAIRAGALGYLAKQASDEDFATAVRKTAAGELFLSSQLADILDADLRQQPPSSRADKLSPREAETLRCIAQGMTYDQAARHMGVSPHTVGTYIKRIHKKIGNGNNAYMAIKAVELGQL